MKHFKLAQAAVKGALWNYVSFAFSKGLIFLTTVILARLLVPKDFGLMALGLLVINYLSNLKDLGIGEAVIYRQKHPERTANVAFCLNVLMGLLLTVIVLLTAPLISVFFQEPRVTPIIRMLSVVFVISALGSIHEVRLRKELDFRRRVIPQITQRFAKGTVSIGLAVTGFGVWSLVCGQMAGTFTATVLYWIVGQWRPRIMFDLNIARSLISYGMHIGVFQILHVIYKNIDYLIIGRRMDAVQLGFYTMAFQLPYLVIYSIQSVVGQAIFPTYTKLQDDQDTLRKAFLTTLQYVSLISVPVGLGMFVVAPEFVEVFYTIRWAPAVPVMQALSLYALINSLSANADQVYKATGRPMIANQVGLVKTLLLIPVLWIAAGYNIFYVAVGQLIISFLAAILQFVIASRMIVIRPGAFWTALRPAATGAAVMLTGLFLLRLQISSFAPVIRLLLMVIWGALLYVSVLWLTNRKLFGQTLAVLRGREKVL
ncbi:lipopolysaccharide biosynthesis protein [Desulfonema magnum]|uniref:Polysaccharide biosynthesis protein n=1 Tax=Desulfonema magnum TaxID=45655 RepID=A0A975GP14_9BACT|nr:lipopolysaccharide biosynthesis protein [Desulfonema magnum]QTA88364.1 Putative polysaccharide biosynthesis protein [Desulfonema magnum]